jgi:hypothetical protein
MTPQEIQEYIKCAKDPIYFLNNYGYVYDIRKSKVDKLSCFDYQENAIRNFVKYQNNIVLKSRQCLPEDTFVNTPNGPKLIKEINKGDIIYSYNFEKNKYELDTVYDHWDCGEIDCVKIKLKDSRNIVIGENHPFFIKNKNKWVSAKDLEIDDEILDQKFQFGEIEADINEIKLLAYLITDGSTIKQVKFTNNNLDYLNEFEESVNYIFPELSLRKIPKLKGFDYLPHQKHGVNTKSPIMKWCENKKIAGKKTENKILPEEVFYWNKDSLSILLNRMFAGDGWISILKKKTNKRLEIGIASPSKEFLEQVKFLLKKFDIKCNIYEVKNMKLQKNRFFKLRITHSKSIIKFINDIGIYKKINSEHILIATSRKHDVKDKSTVRKIERIGKINCYDISVTKNENYFIDGLLVHNTGMSVITAGIVVWMLLFKMDQRILIVANDGAGAIRFLGTVKQYFQFLPKFLFNPDTQSEKDNEKFFSIKNPEGKISWVKAVASSKNAGRGESLTMLILDETAFIENAEDIWMAAGLALSATQGKCIMISTPQGTGNLYHKTWIATKKGESDFVPFQIHWTEHPVYSLEKEQRTDDYGRTYWTSPWYEKECERLQYDRVKIAQELDLSFEGSRQLVIDSGIIEKYKRSIINEKPELFYDYTKPEERFINTKTNFWVWKKPEHGKNYLVGSDVARGDSKDFSTVEVFDADTCEQVAEYQGKIPPDVFGSLIDRVGRDYNNAYLVIECNSFGLATTLNIKNALKYPEDRIYHSKSIKDIINPSAKVRIKENDDIPGIQTTQITRPLIISSLNSYMREGKIKINSVRLLEEFDTFIYNGNKPEHADGFNDDLIFALGVLLFIRDTEYFKNFASRDLYKAMIESISNQRTGIGEKINLDAKSTEGVILTSRNTKADDDNDISWLISS